MSIDLRFDVVEQSFSYSFITPDFLRLALTAAGAEVENHDGNRKLARVGDAAVNLVIEERGYEKSEPRHQVHDFSVFIKSRARRAQAAKRAGIVDSIKLCERSGPASTGTLALAISAIIGAVWKDSRSLIEVGKILDLLIELCPPEPEKSISADVVQKTVPQSRDSELTLLVNEAPAPTDADMVDEESSPREDHMWPAGAQLTGQTDEAGSVRPVDEHAAIASISDAVLTDDAYEAVAREMWSERTISEGPTVQSMDYAMADDDSDGFMFLNAPMSEATASPDPLVAHQETVHGGELEPLSLENRSHSVDSMNPESTPSSDTTHDLDSPIRVHADIFQPISDGICSPGSIVALREIVLAYRMQQNLDLPFPSGRLTPGERLSAIDRIEQQSAYLTFIRRAHIVHLGNEYPNAAMQGDNWLIPNRHQTRPGRGRHGNPLHGAEAAATKLLLLNAHPNLKIGTRAYNTTYRRVQRLRKLGQRLHCLMVRFGTGILGLIQSSDLDSADHLPLNITDSMLLKPSDSDFGNFITFLDQHQGDMLRAFSEAVERIVSGLIGGTLSREESTFLEQAERDVILKQRKGSSGLLELLRP